MHAKLGLETVKIRHGNTFLKKKSSVVCFLHSTDKPSFTAIQNVYVFIYFTFTGDSQLQNQRQLEEQ
jgi:hypothetical protein